MRAGVSWSYELEFELELGVFWPCRSVDVCERKNGFC